MRINPPLRPAKLIRRYKRFLADIRLPSGEETTIHCPNTGSMRHCLVENSPCWYSESTNPKRKYPYTWEIATTTSGYLAGINTARANHLVKEAIENEQVEELKGYTQIKSEVKYGSENSRIDLLLKAAERRDCYVEVKNVTLGLENKQGLFPDSVSTRGTKHLRELAAMVEQGKRAVLFFCVQHTGISQVSPADEIDPTYGNTLRQVMKAGVEVIAYTTQVSPEEIKIETPIPVVT